MAAVDDSFEKIDPALEAAVMAMSSLELEGADGMPLKLKPVGCYRPPADRIARLAAVDPAHGLTPENTVAVTCTVEGGEVVETVVAAGAGGPDPKGCEDCACGPPTGGCATIAFSISSSPVNLALN